MLACDICGGMKFCELNLCSDCKNGVDNMEQNLNSPQQLKAKICQDIVEDILNHLIYSSVISRPEAVDCRDKLFSIVDGKLSAV